jgi:hypothetical protein
MNLDNVQSFRGGESAVIFVLLGYKTLDENFTLLKMTACNIKITTQPIDIIHI